MNVFPPSFRGGERNTRQSWRVIKNPRWLIEIRCFRFNPATLPNRWIIHCDPPRRRALERGSNGGDVGRDVRFLALSRKWGGRWRHVAMEKGDEGENNFKQRRSNELLESLIGC